MSLTQAQFTLIKTEIDTDPEVLGYAGKTYQEKADILSNTGGLNPRDVQYETLSGSQIFEGIDKAEFTALSDTQQSKVRTVISLGDNIQVGPNSRARDWLLDAFGAGSTTRSNLVAILKYETSRAAELGLPEKLSAGQIERAEIRG